VGLEPLYATYLFRNFFIILHFQHFIYLHDYRLDLLHHHHHFLCLSFNLKYLLFELHLYLNLYHFGLYPKIIFFKLLLQLCCFILYFHRL